MNDSAQAGSGMQHASKDVPHGLPQSAWVGHEERVALLRRGAGRRRGRGLGLGRAGRGWRQVQVIEVDRHLGRDGIIAAEHAVRCAQQPAGQVAEICCTSPACLALRGERRARQVSVCNTRPVVLRRATQVCAGVPPRQTYRRCTTESVELRDSAGALRGTGRACFEPDFSIRGRGPRRCRRSVLHFRVREGRGWPPDGESWLHPRRGALQDVRHLQSSCGAGAIGAGLLGACAPKTAVNTSKEPSVHSRRNRGACLH